MTNRTDIDARERHEQHVAAIRAMAIRILEATDEGGALNSEGIERITWGHVGDVQHWHHGLRQVADSMFREGEHAPERNARVSK